MASVTRNRNGSNTVRWVIGRDIQGRMRRDSKTFPTENEAIAHKVAVEAFAGGTGKDSLAARGRQWIEDRLAIGKISEKTAVGYRQKIDAWANLLGPKPYKKITTAEIERAFAALAQGKGPSGRPLSARSLHHYRTILATFSSADAIASRSAPPGSGWHATAVSPSIVSGRVVATITWSGSPGFGSITG